MKPLIFLAVFLLIYTVTTAQVSEYLSFQSAIINKNIQGEFNGQNEWIGNNKKVVVDMSKSKIELFSRTFLDRDPWVLEQAIHLNTMKSIPDSLTNEKYAEFEGTDKSGEKCIVSFKFRKEVNDITDGMLKIEYQDRLQLFKLRKDGK